MTLDAEDHFSSPYSDNSFLSPEVQRGLITQAQGGNQEALGKLIVAYTPLIEKTIRIRGFFPKGVISIEDLKQRVYEGLVRNFNKFSPERGTFSTFVILYTQYTAQQELDELSTTIRIPKSKVRTRDGRKVENATLIRSWLKSESGGENMSQFIQRTGVQISPYELHQMTVFYLGIGSLDAPYGEEGSTIGDFMGDTSLGPDQILEGESIERLLDYLPNLVEEAINFSSIHDKKRAIDMVRRSYGLNLGQASETYSEIGAIYGVTGESVRRTIKSALEHTYSLLQARGLG